MIKKLTTLLAFSVSAIAFAQTGSTSSTSNSAPTASPKAPSASPSTQECPSPEAFAMHSVYLGGSLADVKKLFFNATLDTDGKSIHIPYEDIDTVAPYILSFSHIQLDANQKIASFAVRFSPDVSWAGENVPVEQVLAHVVEKYHLPTVSGWKKQPLMPEGERQELGFSKDAAKMTLQCTHYTVEVRQDFGVGRQSTGAGFTVYRPGTQ